MSRVLPNIDSYMTSARIPALLVKQIEGTPRLAAASW